MKAADNPTKKQSDFRIINAFSLKIIALLTMLIDHLGILLFRYDVNSTMISESTYNIMRIIGRVAFPIFCFMIAEGFYHTKNIRKYIIRLSVFALISQIPYTLAMYQKAFAKHNLNIFFTLLFGLFALIVIDSCIRKIQSASSNATLAYATGLLVLIAILYCAEQFHFSYGCYGILLIIVFYLFRIPEKDFENDAMVLKYTCVQFILVFMLTYALSGDIQFYCLISFVFIVMYSRKKGPNLKLFFYLFYPIHLLVLYGLNLILY